MKLPGLLLAKRFSMANFAITNQCNAACKHCSFPHAVNKCVVGLDEGIRALDSLQRLGVGVVSITGGEPFMVPYLPDLAMHARRGKEPWYCRPAREDTGFGIYFKEVQGQ